MAYINGKKMKQLFEEMMDELYTSATPPISWREINKKYSNTKIQFFRLHHLSQDESEKILDKYVKKFPPYYRNGLRMEWLNYSPTSGKTSTEEELRKELEEKE